MDADNSPERRPTPTQGGTVEPANRPTREQVIPPPEFAGERYELRDPSAEVTYRSNQLERILGKSEELGVDRFVAIDADGRRTTVQKVDGQWQRGPQRPAAPERPLDPTPARDEVREATNVVPMPGKAQPDRTTAAADMPGKANPTRASSARLEAQAERAALLERLETALKERYIIKRAPVRIGNATVGHTEYRFRGDTSRVAFTESTFKLATDTNSPSVARSMVDVAQTRGWKALRVTGNEDFRRLVWLEATARGVKTLGFEPTIGDLDALKREREARLVNRIEPTAEVRPATQVGAAEKGAARGGGGRKAVLAAIEAVLVAKQVPESKRVAVMAAATVKLSQRIRDGQVPRIKVYDKAAPSRRPAVTPTPEITRTRDRATPAPAR